jgi:hypothetical protein
MALNTNARLIRTQRGQGEVRQKSHTLTQTERLILVLVDGITPIDQIPRKLRGLTERRFKLALADLKAKGLVEETASASASVEAPDVLERENVESFVRQDALDPITISSLTLQPQNWVPKSKMVEEPKVGDKADDEQTGGVDFYLPLEPQAPTVNATPVFQVASAPNLITVNGADQRAATSAASVKRARRSRKIQIGYALLFAGLLCAALVFVLLQSR